MTPGEAPKRLDRFLANRQPGLSRSAVQRLIDEGRAAVNGAPAKASYRIRPGDVITLAVPRPEPLALLPEPIPLTILYEDEALLVLDKPAGLVVHPAPGHWSGTLVNALLYHLSAPGSPDGSLSTIGGQERPGLVHRLDKDTSGVMIVAKTDEAHRGLAAQFKQHTITRIYEALIWGVPKKPAGVIDLAIGRDVKERKKFSARTARPKLSVTEYRVVERMGKLAARVELFPKTGRTHQLRVHLSSLGHPILGDPVYGGRKVAAPEGIPVPRVMLHARTLGFTHPATRAYCEFAAPLPPDMEAVRDALAARAGAPAAKPGRTGA
ncbi:RluA family pseudouridine synthase [Nitrospira sp. Kam-Ns4a]